jgi:hypothetical protein
MSSFESRRSPAVSGLGRWSTRCVSDPLGDRPTDLHHSVGFCIEIAPSDGKTAGALSVDYLTLGLFDLA